MRRVALHCAFDKGDQAHKTDIVCPEIDRLVCCALPGPYDPLRRQVRIDVFKVKKCLTVHVTYGRVFAGHDLQQKPPTVSVNPKVGILLTA